MGEMRKEDRHEKVPEVRLEPIRSRTQSDRNKRDEKPVSLVELIRAQDLQPVL